VFLSLEQLRETIATLKENKIKVAYLAYNPNRTSAFRRRSWMISSAP